MPEPSPAASLSDVPAAQRVTTKSCPACGNSVNASATVCPQCRHRFDWAALDKGRPTTKNCPRCKEEIRADARACRHCGTDFYTLRMRQFGTVLILVTAALLVAFCSGAI